jgi:tetratricopeptide (TPR) repeat protein
MKLFMAIPPRLALLAVVVCSVLVGLAQAAQAQRSLDDSPAEADLQKGIALTRGGKFQEAIPHLLAARGQVRDGYAAGFNLALCYVATGRYQPAIEVLNELRSSGHQNADVENLLAQSYIGIRQPEAALAAVQRAARQSPKDEKLFVYVAEACMDSGFFDVGLKVTEIGLTHFPRSGRVIFEHAMLLTHLDRLDEAKQELQKVIELAPGTDVAYIAAAQGSLFEAKVEEAVKVAREGIRKGNQHAMLLALYGEAVMRSGAEPADADFADACAALERAVAERPTYASAQITLGKLYLKEGRLGDAIARLNAGRELDPRNPAVYSNLATAFRRRGDAQQAEAMLAILAKLNLEQVEKIRSAPGDRKAGYAGRARPPE